MNIKPDTGVLYPTRVLAPNPPHSLTTMARSAKTVAAPAPVAPAAEAESKSKKGGKKAAAKEADVAAPVKEAPAKKERKPKAAKEVAAAKEVVAEEAVAADASGKPLSTSDKIAALLADLQKDQLAKNEIDRSIKTKLSDIAKLTGRLQREDAKRASRGTRAASKKRSGGFSSPVEVTADMASFMGLGDDHMTTRLAVSKAIHDYVVRNNLRGEDKRKFNLDQTLTKLFGVEDGVEVGYFTMQKFLSHHFIPAENA